MTSTQQEILSTKLVPPSARPAALHLFLNLTGFIFLPSCKIAPTNQSILLNQEYPIILLLQNLLLTAPIHSAPDCDLCVAPNGVWCPSPQDGEFMWWINCCQSHLSSVGFHVSAILFVVEWGSLSHQWLTKRQSEHTDIFLLY